jgi:hypothetical protein
MIVYECWIRVFRAKLASVETGKPTNEGRVRFTDEWSPRRHGWLPVRHNLGRSDHVGFRIAVLRIALRIALLRLLHNVTHTAHTIINNLHGWRAAQVRRRGRDDTRERRHVD